MHHTLKWNPLERDHGLLCTVHLPYDSDGPIIDQWSLLEQDKQTDTDTNSNSNTDFNSKTLRVSTFN